MSNVALLFAFKDILNSGGNLDSNVLVIDELIDSGIDNYAIQAIVNILQKQMKEKKQTIFLISHKETFDDSMFDNIIELEKKNDISRIISDPQGEILN